MSRFTPRTTTCILVILAVGVAAGTFAINLWRYQTFRSPGPLDLAFFNHQLWNLCHGMAPLTLQPGNFYASEGPEPWRMAQMRLLTFVILPIYALWPGVPTLLAIQSAALGLGVWPIYRLAARRAYLAPGDSPGADTARQPPADNDANEVRAAKWGLAAATFYALSPPVWLLGTLDFRYLTIGLPLALLAYDAMDARRARRYLVFALLAMMARQQFAVVLAVLAGADFLAWILLAALQRHRANRTSAGDSASARHAWSRKGSPFHWLLGPLLLSLAWLGLDQLWLLAQYGPQAVGTYWKGMRNPAAVTSRLEQPVRTVLTGQCPYLLRYGPAVAVAGAAAPHLGLAALALTWPPLRMGQWAVHPGDHFARYTAPAAVTLLAAAAVAFGWLGRWSSRRSRGVSASAWEQPRRVRGPVHVVAGLCLALAALGTALLLWDLFRLPSAFESPERAAIQGALSRIGPDGTVVAAHVEIYGAYRLRDQRSRAAERAAELTDRFWEGFSLLPPLSSRAQLYDYNQLPLQRDPTGALQPVSMQAVLAQADWCILCDPSPWLREGTDELRRALHRSGRFQRTHAVGRVEVYRRTSPAAEPDP